MAEELYQVGQLVEHTLFGYRGVIIGVDPEFNHTDSWYETVAKSRPPKDKPWYHVLVDQSDYITYVAERNLSLTADHQQVEHPLLGQYFNRFDGERYLPRGRLH